MLAHAAAQRRVGVDRADEENAEHGDRLRDDADRRLEEVEDGHEDHEVWGWLVSKGLLWKDIGGV